MAFYPIALPIILSAITLDIRLTQLKGNVLTLVSPSRNITISVNGNTLLADTVPIAHIQAKESLALSIECLSETSLHFSTADNNALIHSPSLCSKLYGIQINESALHGCLSNVFHASKLVVNTICGDSGSRTSTVQPSAGTLQPIYVAEPLEVNEGGSMPLQWKNVYILPEHSRLNISNKDIHFSVVDGPQHGQLLLESQPCSAFDYAQLLARSVVYRHDGSETGQDSFDFQLEMNSKLVTFPWLETTTYTLKIRINPVNDAPELTEAHQGQIIKITSRGSRILSSDQLILADPDDGPDKVRVQVVEGKGIHVRVNNHSASEFTQRQLINRQVSIVDEGVFEKGHLRLVARDADSRSQVLTLHTVSTPIEVRLKTNTGVRLLHHTAVTIGSGNLTFTASVPDLPLFYSVVGLPEHGVVECSPDQGHFAVCSRFSQKQVDNRLVRFRHTSSQHPTQDVFSFQVLSGEFVSMVHNFRVSFIPMNVKVFTREVFMLNGSETGFLSRSHLFAWTFPKSYSPENLIYHVEEPPKFGMLSRRVGTKNRRIGVSSNFTQKDIDDGLIQYKLHFMQFSIVNDFFLFRVVSPAVSSESQRFEVIFVPSEASIQLVNRTVVVEEGQLASVSTDFLSLSTPDDKHFVFTVTIPPNHGSLLLKVNGGGKMTIGRGQNFTTKHISDGKLFYSHSGSETRSDRAYLTAESAFRTDRRIPLWLSFSVILVNDNAPRLAGDRVVEIVERGERILHPNLLNWVDDDVDATPITFDFHQAVKDAAVLSTVSPHRPATLFTSNDLRDGKIMVRHLGHRNNVSIPYTVSDGKYSVEGAIQLLASDPFARVSFSSVDFCCLPGDTPLIVLSLQNLSVVSNLDVKSSDIHFSTLGSGFLLRTKNSWKPVQRFSQQDVEDGLVAYRVHGVEREEISVRVGDRTLSVDFEVSRRSLGSTLELRRSQSLGLPLSGAIVVDSLHLEQGDGATPADQLWFYILKQPQEGSLVLEKENSKPQLAVSKFTQKDVDLGLLQYVHGASGAGRDAFDFNISSPHVTKGPYSLYFDIYDHHVQLSTDTLNVVTGTSAVISTSVVNVSSSDRDDYILKITSQPNYGWIVKDSWNTANISSIASFSGVDLRERRVVYVSDRAQAAFTDHFRLVACISNSTCTSEATVDIQLTRRNVQSPQLVRNEVLRVNGDKAAITNLHLDTEDPDTPTDAVFFLISKPSVGHVAHVDQLNLAVHNFSQKDVDDNLITFVMASNASGSGGFSFLVWDGVHQLGPEWFSTESSAPSSPLLEANARLLAAPGTTTVIGIDLLRANLPMTRPEEVLFSVITPPKHGKLQLNGLETDKFSQQDINKKLIWYSSEGNPQKDWTRKDHFNFVVSRNGSSRPVDQEFRFRISSTYAVIDDGSLVSSSPLSVSKGGSCAFNDTHINLHGLVAAVENEVVLLELGKGPRHGVLEWIDGGRGVISATEFRRGITAIYRHNGEDSFDDSVMFFVYPVSESAKRSSRLRVTVPIQISTTRDPLVQVIAFPPVVSLVSGSFLRLSTDIFYANHPHVPPQSVVYEVIQHGRTGASIRVNGRPKQFFSQEEINSGIVELIHQPVSSSAIPNDVIVFSVEGHTRALLVKVLPLDLALENHTAIEYPQGKTYVVLNRTHLGAFSNGNRSQIVYSVVSGPENGTFYWVAGEKEAKEFTQADIDEGKVLYAQLNMHSYKDAFEFVLTNEEKEAVRNRSEIRVRPLVEVQPVIVESGTATPLTASQLNASLLQGSTPRFLVASTPKYGRITMEPAANQSAFFFTFPDILRGRVFYQAFDSLREVTEHLELEIRADSVQPARLILPITVLPDDGEMDEVPEVGPGSETQLEVPKMAPINDHAPVYILGVILLLTVGILICMNRKKKQKKPEEVVPPTPTRLPPSPRESLTNEKPDLLGSTVFASVGKPLESPRPALKTFSTPTPLAKKRPPPSLDYAGLTGETPPSMPLFKQINAKPKGPTHFWV